MFGLFRKKKDELKISEKILVGETAKWKRLLQHCQQNPQSVLIFWFDESYRQAEPFFTAAGVPASNLFMAREVSAAHVRERNVVMAEHYPLFRQEKALFEKLGLSTVLIFSALEEPLFRQFGGEKIIQLMKQLGMSEDEVIEHKMITNSIRNAQEKIEKKVVYEVAARSQKEWMEKNLPPA